MRSRNITRYKVLLYVAGLLAGATASATYVHCLDYTPGPKECCTLETDSSGAGSLYNWVKHSGPGNIEPEITTYNWSHFHCPSSADGFAEIWVYTYYDPPWDDWVFWGDGGAICHGYD